MIGKKLLETRISKKNNFLDYTIIIYFDFMVLCRFYWKNNRQ